MPTEVSSPPQSDSTAGVSSRAKSAADTDDDDLPTEGQPALASNWFRRAFGQHEVGAWFISAAAHTLILVTFGLLFREVIKQARSVDVNIATKTHIDEPLENLPAELSPGPAGGPSEVQQTPGMFDGDPLLNNLGAAPIGIPDLGTPTKNHDSGVDEVPGMKVDPLASTLLAPHSGAAWGQALSKGGGGFGGRAPGRRGQLVGSGGGTPASEAAVERGLKWLIAHQHEDGGWRFSFEGPPCDDQCTHGGVEISTTAATAMALLPFYGAGYTHKEGPYTDQVNRGLYYLGSRMLITPQGGDLQEGTMYAQGLSTICLCEAYGMSKDENLRAYAQKAVNFILYAQDRHTGGWRYFPGQAGDTTVSGWQLMALKSAQMAGLDVPSGSLFMANKFLDSVQAEKGAAYGYLRPGTEATTTSIGLLCRMFLGWSKTHPALAVGVNGIDKLGPSPTDMYYNYYATQVMFHYHSSAWDRWNQKMRDYLIETQSDQGHEAGSWYFPDRHLDKGGRLCNTSLALLTLEVYYRYLPIYTNKAVEDAF